MATPRRSSRSCTPCRSRHRVEVMHEMGRSFAKRDVAVAPPTGPVTPLSAFHFSICSSNDLSDFKPQTIRCHWAFRALLSNRAQMCDSKWSLTARTKDRCLRPEAF